MSAGMSVLSLVGDVMSGVASGVSTAARTATQTLSHVEPVIAGALDKAVTTSSRHVSSKAHGGIPMKVKVLMEVSEKGWTYGGTILHMLYAFAWWALSILLVQFVFEQADL